MGIKPRVMGKVPIRQLSNHVTDMWEDLYGGTKNAALREMQRGFTGADMFMMNAIRRVNDKPESCVAQVVSGFSPFTANSVPCINKWMRQATVRIRIYTHADMLSDEAIRYISKLAYREDPEMALFFMNVANFNAIKTKQMKDLNLAMTNAAHQCSKKHVLIVGLPNAGKSSIVNPLTRAAVVATRKKKNYHVARVSPTAGRTASIKSHRLDDSFHSCYLIDSPGLLPPPNVVNEHELVLLAATGSLTASSGPPLKKWDLDAVASCLLMGLNAHADLSGVPPPYVKLLKLDGPTTDPQELLSRVVSITEKLSKPQVAERLIRKCREGGLGGLMLEMPGKTQFIDWKEVHHELMDEEKRPTIGGRMLSPIVYMNKAARDLISEIPIMTSGKKGSTVEDMTVKRRGITNAGVQPGTGLRKKNKNI